MILGKCDLLSESVTVIRTLLYSDCWKEKYDSFILKFYINDNDEMVILSKPIKVIKLDYVNKNNFLKVFKETLYGLGLELSVTKTTDTYTLTIPKKKIDECNAKLVSLLPKIIDREKIINAVDNLIYNALKKYEWVELSNGLSYLEYNINYMNGKVIVIIGEDVYRYNINEEEYGLFEKVLDERANDYRVVRYGNGNNKRYLSTYDLVKSNMIYNYNKELTRKK